MEMWYPNFADVIKGVFGNKGKGKSKMSKNIPRKQKQQPISIKYFYYQLFFISYENVLILYQFILLLCSNGGGCNNSSNIIQCY